MNDVRISSWCQLQDELFHGAWNERIQRFRAPFAFRGLSDSRYRLETSLMRMGGPYASLERHLLRNFRKYGQSTTRQFPAFWHLLALAQHYGLPTRLLDWTFSPNVALHFATANFEKFDIDGAIWVVDYERAHTLLPGLLRRNLEEEGAQAFTIELLSRVYAADDGGVEGSFQDVIRSLEEFDELAAAGDFLLFFEPPSLDERIVNQFALFSVMPSPTRAVDSWLQEHPELYRRLIIPHGLKWECRDKLDQCNVTERVLFPGLGGLSSWLRRHYSPRVNDGTCDCSAGVGPPSCYCCP